MPANACMPRLWSRRGLLIALAAGSVTMLSACRVQLDENAPHIPLVPTRAPMEDEKPLLEVLGRTRSLQSLARALGEAPTSIVARLGTVHATQVAVITRLLRDGGVPQSLIGGSPATGPTGSLTHPVLSAATLSAAESESVSYVALADISSAHVALIGSMLAQRIASVTLLGGAATPAPPPGFSSPEAVQLLEATRAAVYGFEVVAAQIDSTGRALAMSTLLSLRTRTSELQALVGSSGPPPPLGYELPFPVADPDSARRLAQHLLEALLTRQAAALVPAAGEAAALTTLVHWLGATESTASQWGASLAAFPGLTNG
jgi:Domain of unknown function (DUF4439)